jgi:cell envelope-related function transcriptional attenuator common domain
MKQQKTSSLKITINWMGISWLILLILSVVFFFIAVGFIAFPPKYILPLGIILALIDALMGYFSLKRKKKISNKKKSVKKIIVTVVNCILCILLAAGSIYLPILQSQMKGMFVEPTDTQEVKINAYVMTSAYKSAHTDIFTDTNTSTNFEDYKDKKFLIQSTVDKDNQAYALEDIQKELNVNSLNTIAEKSNASAAYDLYNGTGDVMLLNENYEASFADISGYENFKYDTQILYTTVINVKVEKKETVTQDYTNTPFCVYIAGSDTRSTQLSYYTRTDVDLLLTVDPINKQILLISIPRDWYVKNPALGNGFDKLTHLGNDGLQNTVDGLNQEFSFDYIKNYFEVNFTTFYNIVEAIGGIDINNPYAFTLNNGAAEDTGHGESIGYLFEEGNLHLNGDQALSYVRERYNLPNGDYGRNEHQAIVLQAIINKIASKEIISNYNNLLNGLQGNFLTSMSSDDIFSLAKMQLNDGGKWNFISYHLTGVGGSDVTASMGDQLLYVSYPLAEQVTFAKQQITSVMNGEVISQDTLPTEDQTVYLPN